MTTRPSTLRDQPDRRVRCLSERRGFTLVELLVVLAIILVVIGLVIVATRALRQAGDRANSSAALRQLATAHAMYSGDHRQRLLPGFINPQLQSDLGISVVGPNDTAVPAAAAAPWPWRLAPYLGDQWSIFLADSGNQSNRALIAQQISADDLLNMALHPSFGMNTIFVGGDSQAGGVANLSPWNTMGNATIAATRVSEIPNPSSVVLFAPTQRTAGAGGGSAIDRGYYELRAPALEFDQWSMSDGVATPTAQMVAPAGIPWVRSEGDVIPVVHVDGSVQQASLQGLAIDMRRWSPYANRPDWRVGD